jgi:hypothetical protein
VVPVISRAESLRALHADGRAIYNLGQVVADMETPMLKINVPSLVSCHVCRVARMRQECNRKSTSLSVNYTSLLFLMWRRSSGG